MVECATRKKQPLEMQDSIAGHSYHKDRLAVTEDSPWCLQRAIVLRYKQTIDKDANDQESTTNHNMTTRRHQSRRMEKRNKTI